MIDAFNNDRDIHTETAIRAFNDASRRADGKTKNFQLVYGGGSEEDKELMFKIYPQIKSWSDRQYDEFESIGTARSMFGRMMTIGEGGNLSEFRQEHKKQFEDLARSGMSLKIQGSCAEICKIGMTKVWKYIKDSDIKMVLQVHDEIVLEVPDDLVQDAADLMYDNMKYSDGLLLTMPIEVKVGDNWNEMIKIKHSSQQPATKTVVAV
jgi:DNA polymerase-1